MKQEKNKQYKYKVEKTKWWKVSGTTFLLVSLVIFLLHSDSWLKKQKLINHGREVFFFLLVITGEIKHRFIFNSLLYTSYTYSSKHGGVTPRVTPTDRLLQELDGTERTAVMIICFSRIYCSTEKQIIPIINKLLPLWGVTWERHPAVVSVFPATEGYTSSCKDKGLAKKLRMEPNGNLPTTSQKTRKRTNRRTTGERKHDPQEGSYRTMRKQKEKKKKRQIIIIIIRIIKWD